MRANILIYPLAGALVDRWNRKIVMMLSALRAWILGTIISLDGYLFKAVRDIEEIIPDHDVINELSEFSVEE